VPPLHGGTSQTGLVRPFRHQDRRARGRPHAGEHRITERVHVKERQGKIEVTSPRVQVLRAPASASPPTGVSGGGRESQSTPFGLPRRVVPEGVGTVMGAIGDRGRKRGCELSGSPNQRCKNESSLAGGQGPSASGVVVQRPACHLSSEPQVSAHFPQNPGASVDRASGWHGLG